MLLVDPASKHLVFELLETYERSNWYLEISRPATSNIDRCVAVDYGSVGAVLGRDLQTSCTCLLFECI
jgi:hypothetical protein